MTKKRKKTIKRIKIARSLIYLGLSIAMIVGLATTALRVFSTYLSFITVEATHKNLELQKEELKKEVELLKDEEYIIRYARENYVFTKEGENATFLPEHPQINNHE